MDFEGAALLHQRVAKIEAVLSLRDELARSVGQLNAVAVLPSAEPECVELAWIRDGHWRGFTRLLLASTDGRPVSLDARLRECATRLSVESIPPAIRTEQLALLARWYYATWRDGELLLAEAWDKLPWRKIVNSIARVAAGKEAGTPKENPPKARPNTHSPSSGSPPPPDPPRSAG
jgi:hypothetical protein